MTIENRFSQVSADEITKMLDKMEYDSSVNIYRRLLTYLDLTSLNASDNEDSIGRMIENVNNFGYTFPDLPNIAAICVYPRFVPLVRKTLQIEEIVNS